MNLTEQLQLSRAFLYGAINDAARKAHEAGKRDVLRARSEMDLRFAFFRRSQGQRRRWNHGLVATTTAA